MVITEFCSLVYLGETRAHAPHSTKSRGLSLSISGSAHAQMEVTSPFPGRPSAVPTPGPFSAVPAGLVTDRWERQRARARGTMSALSRLLVGQALRPVLRREEAFSLAWILSENVWGGDGDIRL